MISDKYARLLETLGESCPVSSLAKDTSPNLIALRHDIDHDLGVALDLARVEFDSGKHRATYYILHTAPYCSDPLFLDRLKQLVDYGHELGLHFDGIGAWWRGETNTPLDDARRFIDRLLKAGLEIRGHSPHGCRECYEGEFVNNWFWTEQKKRYTELQGPFNAEGILASSTERDFLLPKDDYLIRPDGAKLELWAISQSELGLEHEALSLTYDRYWTDSGGNWNRSGKPTKGSLKKGRHQVLAHPWWWRAPRSTTMVLSTARSGTKWLTERISARTSALALHERTLNQREATTDLVFGLKRTSSDLVGLLSNKSRVKNLVSRGLAAHKKTKRDVFEANVYLAHVDPALLTKDDVRVIHLHRNPELVVRSILQRDWYLSNADRQHPRFDQDWNWVNCSQLEKACIYWTETNRGIIENFPDAERFRAEDLQSDDTVLSKITDLLGLSNHPRLTALDQLITEPVDQTKNWEVPPFSTWILPLQKRLWEICGPVARALGRTPRFYPDTIELSRGVGGRYVKDFVTLEYGLVAGEILNTQLSVDESASLIIQSNASQSGYVVLSQEFNWSGTTPPSPNLPLTDTPTIIKGGLEWEMITGDCTARLIICGVDINGDVTERKSVIRIDHESASAHFSTAFDETIVSVFPVIFIDHSPSKCIVRIRALELSYAEGEAVVW